jgi:hypothetical protein
VPSLADAWVSVGPDLGDFATKVKASVTDAVKRAAASVKIDANTAPALAAGTDLKAKLDALAKRVTEFKVDLGDKSAQAKILDMRAKLDALGKKVSKPDIDLQGVLRTEASILRVDAMLDKLSAKTARPKIDTGGGSGGLGGLLGKLGGGGSGGGAGTAAGDAGGAGPAGWIAAATAGLIALPVIAEAAANATVLAFGAGLAGLGVAGALQSAKVQQDFAALKANAVDDLGDIGSSFVPVMESVANTATNVLNGLTPVFSNAAKTISGPFQAVATTLEKSFAQPAVARSISAVASAFASLLTSVTPQIGPDIAAVANAITGIANSISKNPGAFAAFVKFLTDSVVDALGFFTWINDHWKTIGPILALPFTEAYSTVKSVVDLIGGLFKVLAGVLSGNWGAAWRALKTTAGQVGGAILDQVTALWDAIVPKRLRLEIATVFDDIRHDQAAEWSHIYSDTIGTVIRIGHDTEAKFDDYRHSYAATFDGVRHDIAHDWDSIYNDTIGSVIRLGHDVEAKFDDLAGWIHHTFGTDISNFFTIALPGYFASAVTLIGQKWGQLEHTLATPVEAVLANVLDPLFGAIDDVTNFVGLGSPLPRGLKLPGFAAGSRIPGYGGGDVIPALLERGETVVSKEHSRELAGAFRAVGVPGYASGGIPGGGVLHNITHALSSIPSDLMSIFGGAPTDIAKILVALATGNATAADNAFTSLLGKGGSGALGDLGTTLANVPATLIKDAVQFLISPTKAFASAKQAAAAGPVGRVSGNEASVITALLGALGAPSTGANQSAMARWIARETPWPPVARYNPMNTTLSAAGATDFNSIGVKNYVSWAEGVTANADTILNGYPTILGDLRAGGGIGGNAAGDLLKWSGGGYSSVRLGGLAGKTFDNGGVLAPGLNFAWNRTGKPETVVPVKSGGGSLTAGERMLSRKLDALISATQAAPRRFGETVAGNLSRGVARGYYGR